MRTGGQTDMTKLIDAFRAWLGEYQQISIRLKIPGQSENKNAAEEYRNAVSIYGRYLAL
jgi:hypothetical protein